MDNYNPERGDFQLPRLTSRGYIVWKLEDDFPEVAGLEIQLWIVSWEVWRHYNPVWNSINFDGQEKSNDFNALFQWQPSNTSDEFYPCYPMNVHKSRHILKMMVPVFLCTDLASDVFSKMEPSNSQSATWVTVTFQGVLGSHLTKEVVLVLCFDTLAAAEVATLGPSVFGVKVLWPGGTSNHRNPWGSDFSVENGRFVIPSWGFQTWCFALWHFWQDLNAPIKDVVWKI